MGKKRALPQAGAAQNITIKKNIKKRKLKETETTSEVSSDQKTATTTAEETKILRYTVSEKYATERHLFLKRDVSNENSLLVANIPSYLNKDFVRKFLCQFVEVPIVAFEVLRSTTLDGDLQQGQLTCSVRFESASGVAQAMRQCHTVGPYRVSDFVDEEPASVLKNAFEEYKSIFSRPDEIEAAVNEYISQQDEAAIQAKREAKRKLTEPDDDGWITVTKAAKKVGKAVVLKKNEIPLMGGLRKKKKEVDLAFYSFQTKQSKAQKASELRAKFEEDKKRVAMLKNARKFNPM